MKNKKIFIIGILVVVLLEIYFGIKGVYLYIYNNSKITDDAHYINELKEVLENKGSITVNVVDCEDYFTYEGLKIRNDFELDNSVGRKYVYKIKNSETKVLFNKYSRDYIIKSIEEDSKNMELQYDIKKELEDNNVDTYYEFDEYLINNVNSNLNIFSSVQNLKRGTSINLLANVKLFSYKKVTLINGDIDGYIMENENSRAIYINHDDYFYVISIFDKMYSEEELVNLISTVKFE